jgi:hypothetical protein
VGSYPIAVCCDGIFHPGSDCCSDDQCDDGVCADGTCVSRLMVTPYGASPLGAPVHVLLVIADRDDLPAPAEGRCFDRSETLVPRLGLDRVAAYFRDLYARRTGLPAPPWRFTVLTGFETDAIDGASLDDMRAYAPALERHLVEEGCVGSFQAEFDRVVVHTPRFTTRRGGLAFDVDRVGLRAYSPALLAHELGHSFGATDLYLDARGLHARDGALMSSSGGSEVAIFREDVMRAEIGLDDVDGDGVLDAVGYSHAPDALLLEELRVTHVVAGTITVHLRVQGREEDGVHPLVPREVVVELPELGIEAPLSLRAARSEAADATRLTAYLPGLPEEAVAVGAPLRVRVRARVDFSVAPEFGRVARHLDETRALEVRAPGT